MNYDINYDIIISVIIGIIVSIVLFISIKQSVIYKGPNSKDVKNRIFTRDDKCYMFEPVVYLCP